jgi:hypothetical protein
LALLVMPHTQWQNLHVVLALVALWRAMQLQARSERSNGETMRAARQATRLFRGYK